MKTKVSCYSNIVKHVRRVCKHPSPAMLDVYNSGGKRMLQDNDLMMSLHLAVNLSERYRLVKVPVWHSRELEMIVYDLFLKGYSTMEMMLVCQVASHNKYHEEMSNTAFTYMTDLVMKSAQEHGDVIFKLNNDLWMVQKEHKVQCPEMTDERFSNN